MKMNRRCFTSVLLTVMLGWLAMAEEIAPPAADGDVHNNLFAELLEIPEAGAEFPPDVFTLKWETAIGVAREPDRYYPYPRPPELVVSARPVYMVLLSEDAATMLDADTQTVVHSIALPEGISTKESQGNSLDVIYLNTPEGGAIAGVQTILDIAEDGRRAWIWKFFIKPVAGEAATWSRISNRDVGKLFRLPISEAEDLLVFTSGEQTLFMDYQGNIRANLPVPKETVSFEIVEAPSGEMQLLWADKQTARSYTMSWNAGNGVDDESIEGGGE